MKTYLNRVLSSVTALSLVAVSFAGVLSAPGTALAATTSFSASRDAHVEQNHVNTNYGNDNHLDVKSKDGSDNKRTLIAFDLSSIPTGSTITSASVKLYVNGAPADTRTHNAHRVTSSWAENTVTWNTLPTYSGTPTASADVTADSNHTIMSWNVTTDVDAFVNGASTNNGWLIKDVSEDANKTEEAIYASRNQSVNPGPELVVVYTPPADTEAPVINAHADITIEATSSAGATVTYTAPNAVDDVDGTFPATCTPSSGSVFALGNTTVTCNAQDTAGNDATPTPFVVHVVDTTPPVITLNDGLPTISLTVGASFTDAGATATDIVDSDVPVTVGGDTVNPSVPGIYIITYDAVDDAGNPAIQVTRTVTVSDVGAPVVTVTPSSQTVEATGPTGAVADFTVTAVDDIDGDISSSVTCNHTSGDTFPLGVTTVTCSATDSSENTGSGSATITVVDTTPPVITLNDGLPTISLTVGASFTDAGATATDIVDSDVPVTVGGDTVNPSVPGIYIITYDAVDDAGNPAIQVTRTVTVSAVPPADLCDNIPGVQNPVPEGMVANDGVCTTPVQPVDVCSNIEGAQATVPEGMTQSNGICEQEERRNSSGSRPTGSVLGASTGQVLGESCGLYMDQYLKRGNPKNNPAQVTKLQAFLVKHGFGTFTPTGFFGPLTEASVKAFQAKYSNEVLVPWNIAAPTGLAYLTTLRQVNLIECPDLMIPVPALVDWNKNPAVK